MSTPTPTPSLVIHASDVQSRSIRWGWIGRLALGYLTVMTGIEGLGKSVFACWLIARLTHGDLPGEWRGQPVTVLIVAGEDGIADTWKPRLDLAGADPDRVHFLNLAALGDDWNLRDGIDAIRDAVIETSARVLFIDSALEHMPPARAAESINSPTFVRRALSPLRRTVRDLDLIGLFSMHPPKARSADFRDLVQASQAFSAIPRIGLLFAYHPDDEADDPADRRRVVIRGKGNLGRDPGAIEFRIAERPYHHDDGRTTQREVVIDVAPSAVTLADLAPDRATGARPPTKAERAADVIRAALPADGAWHVVAPIRATLEAQGLASRSVMTSATQLAGVESRKRTGEVDGPWEWRRTVGQFDARARATIPNNGQFDFSPENPNDNGNCPTVRDLEPTEAHSRTVHPSEDLRAREAETDGDDYGHDTHWADDGTDYDELLGRLTALIADDDEDQR